MPHKIDRSELKAVARKVAAVACKVAATHKAASREAPATNKEEFAVGNYVKFGSYPQSKSGMGDTPIKWLVLARDGDKALLISKYALDCVRYNEERMFVTWETCTLRKWLNNNFYNRAFSADEQQYIVESVVTADIDPIHDTKLGNDTTDKVFLLSNTEAHKYFSNDNARICYATAYAEEHCALKGIDGEACMWWLRSSGHRGYEAACVSSDGSLYSRSCLYDFDIFPCRRHDADVDCTNLNVRPAVWVRPF